MMSEIIYTMAVREYDLAYLRPRICRPSYWTVVAGACDPADRSPRDEPRGCCSLAPISAGVHRRVVICLDGRYQGPL